MSSESEGGDSGFKDHALDRLPPFAMEAEQGVLGCILLTPIESLTECIAKLKPGAKAFYDLRHQCIYARLLDMFNQQVPIDLITVTQELRDLLQLEGVGGIGYVASLPDAVPSAANLQHYLEILMEKYTLRQMLRVCTEAAAAVFEGASDVSKMLTRLEKDVASIVSDSQNTETLYKVGSLLEKFEQQIVKFQSNPGTLDGLSTGFIDVDKITQGLRSPEVIVIAARPSTGKSAIGMNIAEHNAVTLGLPVGFFSLEMAADTLMFRLACGRAKVSMTTVKAGALTDQDLQKLATAQSEIQNAPLYIDDEAGLSVLQFKAKARRMVSLYNLKLLVLDYLQLLHATTMGRYMGREFEVATISKEIKLLAKELGIPIIVLSQLNRDIERAGNRRPRMSDIRESGAVENDADIIAALWRAKPGVIDDEDGPSQKFAEVIDLAFLKSRNGPTGDCKLTFIRPWTKFTNIMT